MNLRPLQGLYEYVKPSWQERPHPEVDQELVKVFGQNIPSRPLNPSVNELQLYPMSSEMDGIKVPRYDRFCLATSGICLCHSWGLGRGGTRCAWFFKDLGGFGELLIKVKRTGIAYLFPYRTGEENTLCVYKFFKTTFPHATPLFSTPPPHLIRATSPPFFPPPPPPYSIDRTLKMYVGGGQKRPDAPYVRPVMSPSGQVIGQVSEGNRKDIREAVEAAHKAAPG